MNNKIQAILQKCAKDEHFLDVSDPNYGKAPGLKEMSEDLAKIFTLENTIRIFLISVLTFWIGYLIYSLPK